MNRWSLIVIAVLFGLGIVIAVLFGLGVASPGVASPGVASPASSGGAGLAAVDDPLLVLAAARAHVDALPTDMNDIDTSGSSLYEPSTAVEYRDIANRGKRVGLSLLYDHLLYDHRWAAGACDAAREAYARAARMFGLTAAYYAAHYEQLAAIFDWSNVESGYLGLVRAAADEAFAAREAADDLHEMCVEERTVGG